MIMRFAKGHGTENDFVILPDTAGALPLTAALAARLCDRRAGIGGDGVLRVVPAEAAIAEGVDIAGDPPGWFMDYRNADGSLAEMCGNGARVFARYLARHGLVSGTEFMIATRAGARAVGLAPGGDVTVEMGPVTIGGEGVAALGGETHQGLRVSVGNPHLACLVDRPLAAFDLTVAPVFDPREFPAGANLELIQLTGDGSVSMRVRERGSGETRSCGTGAVAAAAAAQRVEGGDRREWRVTVPGGTLTVTLEDGASWLTGPAVIVAEGELDPAWLTAS